MHTPHAEDSGPPTTATTTSWRLVIPVKDTRVGKSRLAHLGGANRQRLSLAIADDTVRAAVATVGADRVLLVTSDVELRRSWGAQGVSLHDDPDAGLNDALAMGLASLGSGSEPGAGHGPYPLAALLGDLPALRPVDLRSALDAALPRALSFVPDSDGTGTVLLCRGMRGGPITPRFGPRSAAAHAGLGADRLDLDLPRLRTDVDDDDSLASAEALGLGAATRSVLADLREGASQG